MATFQRDLVLLRAFAFAYTMCHSVGLLQMPSPADVTQALVPCRPLDTMCTDVHDTSSPPSSATYNFDGDWIDATNGYHVRKFGMTPPKTDFVWLYHLVNALVDQATAIVSDTVSLKDRITAVEGTHSPGSVHGQETEALARRVSALCERVASQEDRITGLELFQRAEMESHKKTIQELSNKVDDMKIDDAFQSLCRSSKNFQQSMECQTARITGIKADTALKIALLQSQLAGVRAELASVRTMAVPASASSAGQGTKEAPTGRILTGVAPCMEDAEMAEEKLTLLPPAVVQGLTGTTVSQDIRTASISSTSPKYGKPEEATVNDINITKEPLTITRTNVARPDTNEIPAISIPPMLMEDLIPAKSNSKENKLCNSSATAPQYIQPGAGRSPKVKGSTSTVSAPPKSRRSMLPAPRRSVPPSLSKNDITDGSLSNEVKVADRLPGGSATQTKQPKTVEIAPIAMRRPRSESASTLVEKQLPAMLPTSSSLAALDAALQAMWVEDDNLLTLIPVLNCSNDDLSFSAITVSTKMKGNNRYESIYVPSKRENVNAKPSRSPLKSTSENKGSLSTSSSLVALDAALHTLQGQDDVLTLMPGPDYATVDFGSSAVTPVFATPSILIPADEAPRADHDISAARPHCKHESICVSPKKTSTVKPSRRL